jgi:peptide/nickel transport system permease protein
VAAVIPAEEAVGSRMDPRAQLGALWRHPVLRALLKALLTVLVATSITFVLIRLLPGNPVDLRIDELTRDGSMTYEQARDQVSTIYPIDLNDPIPVQFLNYLWNVVRGDLGNSYLSSTASVTSIIFAVLPWTLFAVGTGQLLSFVVGIALGLLAAYHRGSFFDQAVSTLGSIISSVPSYLIAILIVLIFGVQLELIPITQMRGALSPGIHPGFTLDFIGDVFFHAALPIFVYFLANVGHWILSMRNATLAALEEDYVVSARARGLSESRITTAYVGRNAALPLVTQLAIAVGFILGGAVLIEQVFLYQGVGLRLLRAVAQRDYPVMQGILLLVTVSVVFANLAADLLYSRLDPRIGRAS